MEKETTLSSLDAPSCSLSWRSSAFMLSDAMDAAEFIQSAARDYAPESRSEFYEAIRDEIEKLISEANSKAHGAAKEKL